MIPLPVGQSSTSARKSKLKKKKKDLDVEDQSGIDVHPVHHRDGPLLRILGAPRHAPRPVKAAKTSDRLFDMQV